MPFRRKVTKGAPRPVKGHFGASPEFEEFQPGVKPPKPPIKSKRKKPAIPARP